MSLSDFLAIPDVREHFKQQFVKPKIKFQKAILVPPRTRRYAMVGTAFDYLLRFYIKRQNPNAVERLWIAEHAARPSLSRQLSVAQEMGGMATYNATTGEYFIFNEQTGKTIPFPETSEMKTAKEIVAQAKVVYQAYLASGDMTDAVIKAAILLAQLDPMFRAGYVDENLGAIDSEDVADLRALISLVKPDIFTAKELCVLNPTFGEASRMVGGADADLLIDDMLVDIKTTKSIQFTLDNFLQLIGYYVLSRISGVDNAPRQHSIERLGVYYSRYAELCVIPVAEVVNEATFEPFIHWFKERTGKNKRGLKDLRLTDKDKKMDTPDDRDVKFILSDDRVIELPEAMNRLMCIVSKKEMRPIDAILYYRDGKQMRLEWVGGTPTTAGYLEEIDVETGKITRRFDIPSENQ